MLPLFIAIAFVAIIVVYLAWREWIISRPEIPYQINDKELVFGGFKGIEHLLSAERATPVNLQIPLVDINKVQPFNFEKYHGSRWGSPHQRSPGTIVSGDYFDIWFSGKMPDSDKYTCLETDREEHEKVTADVELSTQLSNIEQNFSVPKSFRNSMMIEVILSYGIIFFCVWVIIATPPVGLIFTFLASNIFIYNYFFFPKNLYSLYILPDLKISLHNGRLNFTNSTSKKSVAKLPRLVLPQKELDLGTLNKVVFAPFEKGYWPKFTRYHLYLQYELHFKHDAEEHEVYRFTALCDENAALFKILFLIAQQNHYRDIEQLPVIN